MDASKNKPNQYGKAVLALEAINNVAAPAQKHATDDAVYTALFLLFFVFLKRHSSCFVRLWVSMIVTRLVFS